MGKTTGIAWTDHTFNPWIGCTKVSPACANCYMYREMRRYGRDPDVVVRTKTWGQPLKWQAEAKAAGRIDMVFTCSWSDWFHEAADAWRDDAWAIVKACPNLIFQVLTKRADRIAGHLPADWGAGYPNVWLGVSAENQLMANRRVPALLDVNAVVRFVSAEPLLSALSLRLIGVEHAHGVDCWNALTGFRGNVGGGYESGRKIHWVIVGGESGPRGEIRSSQIGWFTALQHECAGTGTAFFMKQLGAIPTGLGPDVVWPDNSFARLVDSGRYAPILKDRAGADPAEWPASLRVQEFPRV